MATDSSFKRSQLMPELRKHFVLDAGRAMRDISGACQERLTSLLGETVRLREMQSRRDAWTFYQKAKLPWLEGTLQAWQKALLPAAPPTSAKKLDNESFQLVGTDVVEDKILSSRLVRGVMDKVGSQIDDLKVRVRLLEDIVEFEEHDVLRLDVLILPMVEQWTRAGMPRDAWPFVHEVVLRMLAERLLVAYTKANEYLIEHGILPKIDLKDRAKRTTNSNAPLPQREPLRAQARGGDPTASTFGIDAGTYSGNSTTALTPGGQRGAAPSSGAGSVGGHSGFGHPAHPGPQGGYSGGQGGQYSQGSHQGGAHGAGAGFAGGLTGHASGASGVRAEGAFGGRMGWGGDAPEGSGAGAPQGQNQPRNPSQNQPAPQGFAGQAGGPQGSYAAEGQNFGGAHQHHHQAPTGYSNAHEETRMLTATTPLARARSRAQGVMGQLKRLLVGRIGSDGDDTQYQPASPALAAAIAVRPNRETDGYGDGGTVVDEYSPAGVAKVAGRLREQTTELKKKAETKGEKATIEIVALMFQAILQEDRIPPGIRVWFARLQMPVLRVALEEPDFFGTLNHPARQLIDRMGSCVMGFDASGVHGSAIETEIKRVVQVIEQYPETGKRVYQLVYDEFVKFLGKFLTEKGSTQKVVSVAQQVEQKETLTIQYTIEMRNMLKDLPVREEIREFLFKVWAEVLAVAAVRKGPQHAETLELKKCATDLVWAASAKPNRSDRARVIGELPKLLQHLRTGMGLLGLPPSEQDKHVKTVSDTLADAFLSKTQAIPQAQIEMMAKRLANLEDFVSEDGMGDLPLDADSIEIMLGIDASSIDVVTDGGSKPTVAMLAWAQELQLGAWFTLDHSTRVTKVQFAWRSERKHLNLFASPDGHSYLIQAGRLAAYLQAGLLLPQEEETLTVRATRDALAKLEANPERLLG